jgi:hypothetical protein
MLCLLLRSCLTSALSVSGGLTVLPPAIPVDTGVSTQLVAVGTIQQVGRALPRIYLPVTIHGHAGTVVLDLGASAGLILAPGAAAALGIDTTAAQLDVLMLGTTLEQHVPLNAHGIALPIPAGLPPFVGILGSFAVQQEDILLDGPAQRVLVYRHSVSSAVRHGVSSWLPTGITAADCHPMPHFPNIAIGVNQVRLPLTVNGQAVQSFFDSGSPTTIMNLAAAQLLGFTQHSSTLQLLPDSARQSYPFDGGTTKYVVMGLTLALGAQRLAAIPVRIVVGQPLVEPPEVRLGLDAVQDRWFLVSYPADQVCLSAARPLVLSTRSTSSETAVPTERHPLPPAVAPGHGRQQNIQRDAGAVSSTADTTLPRLTVALVTEFQTVDQVLRKLPQAIQDSVPQIQFTPDLRVPGVPQAQIGAPDSLRNWGTFAAHAPHVAALFRHAHLAPRQYAPLERAIMNAFIAGTLVITTQPQLVVDTSTVLGQNLAFALTHRTLMGLDRVPQRANPSADLTP